MTGLAGHYCRNEEPLCLTGAIRDAVRTLEARGVVFAGPIVTEDKTGEFAYLADPDGNSLNLAQMQPALRNEAAGVR